MYSVSYSFSLQFCISILLVYYIITLYKKKNKSKNNIYLYNIEMNKLQEDILKSRTIKPISLRNYLASLNQLCKRLTKKSLDCDISFLTDTPRVIKLIEGIEKKTTQKNYLTAIIVALKAYQDKYEKEIEIYSKLLKQITDNYNNNLKQENKTETQKANWLDYDDLIKVKDDLKQKYKRDKTFENLQKYLILLTYINHPLRNDFSEMKILTNKEYKKLDDKDKDKYNYLIVSSRNKMRFQLNNYKNKNRLGQREIEIVNKELKQAINLWLKVNKSGWYFVKQDKTTPQTANGTTKYLNAIFKPYNKKISSSMIRHILISHDYADEKTMKQKQQEEEQHENKYLNSKAIAEKVYRKV